MRDNRSPSVREGLKMFENPLAVIHKKGKRMSKRMSRRGGGGGGGGNEEGLELKNFDGNGGGGGGDGSKELDEAEEREKSEGKGGEKWQDCVDPASGKKYRYNESTGVTEWAEDLVRGAGVALSDEELIKLLKKPPRDVPEMHSREAFKVFLRGITKKRLKHVLGIVYEGQEGLSEEEKAFKVKKRLKLLDGEFAGDKEFAD